MFPIALPARNSGRGAVQPCAARLGGAPVLFAVCRGGWLLHTRIEVPAVQSSGITAVWWQNHACSSSWSRILLPLISTCDQTDSNQIVTPEHSHFNYIRCFVEFIHGKALLKALEGGLAIGEDHNSLGLSCVSKCHVVHLPAVCLQQG